MAKVSSKKVGFLPDYRPRGPGIGGNLESDDIKQVIADYEADSGAEVLKEESPDPATPGEG